MSDELTSMVDEHMTGCFSTGPVENMNNIQKNNTQFKGKRKYKRPARGMGIVIQNRLFEKRYPIAQ